MKKKGTINPPSKKESSDDAAFERLKGDYIKAKRAYNEVSYRRNRNIHYENMLIRVSSELDVDKKSLDKAYQDDKGKLTSAFANYNIAKRDVTEIFDSVVPYSAGTSAVMGLAACFVEKPGAFVFVSVFLAAWGALNATIGMSAKKDLKKAHEDIKAKTLEFHDHKRPSLPSQTTSPTTQTHLRAA